MKALYNGEYIELNNELIPGELELDSIKELKKLEHRKKKKEEDEKKLEDTIEIQIGDING